MAARKAEAGKGKEPQRRLDSRYKWALRGAALKQLLGVHDSEDYLKKVTRARSHIARMAALPRGAADPGRPLKRAVEVISGAKGIKAGSAKNPAKGFSFGSTGQFVEVRSERAFHQASLCFKVEERNVRHLDTRTIVVAHWDERGRRFHAIPQSGYNPKHGYAYARVTQPGVYTAIGLPRDPRIRTTLGMMRNMSAWTGLDKSMGFNEKLCPVVLCNGELQKAVDEFKQTGKGELAGLGYSPDDFGGYRGGNVCEQCLHGEGPFVEIDLIGPHDPVLEPGHEFELSVVVEQCRAWESIGPDNIPGRITSLAVHKNGRIVYAGSADGGVFKTIDGGEHWQALWSQELSLAIGGLAIAPSNPEIVYASTGEWGLGADMGVLTIPGYYFYRTTNGGASWERRGTIVTSSYTNGVAVDPADPNRVYVAGNLSLHRSTNGGATWDVTGLTAADPPEQGPNVFGILDGTISDIVVDPSRHDRLWAGVHDEGVWYSENGGDSWTHVAGLPAGYAPRIAFGQAGAHGTDFMAVKIGTRIFTSTDRGASFAEKTSVRDSHTADYYAYCSVIAVHPDDENVLLSGCVWLVRSTDGGANWVDVWPNLYYHVDLHALVHDPASPGHMYLATDGGVFDSTDGVNWPAKNQGLATTQCYSVGVSQGATLAYGITTQDNFLYRWSADNSFVQYGGIGSEGGYVEYDPQDANRVYADVWFAPYTLQRSDNGGDAPWHDLAISTENAPYFYFGKGLAIAWNDTSLLLALKCDAVPAGSRVPIARSENRGDTWQDVLDLPNVIISVVKFAPSDDNHAYAGSIDGHVWHSKDQGRTWVELAQGPLPGNRVQEIQVDWRNPLRLYVAFAAYSFGQQVWRGDLDADGNVTWFNVSGATPAGTLPNLQVIGMVLDPGFEDTIYVSNMLGVSRSTDGGDSWAAFDEGLPNCTVSHMMIRKFDRTLYASTFGRGVYRRCV